jgi:diguanylate cyclase (GGDEF)-like protein
LRATRTSSEASASPQRHGVAAVVSGLGVLSARWLALAAVGLPIPGVTASQTVIASGSMTMLASVGGTELLLVMLLACVIETRMRHRLENARSELQAHAHRDDLTRLPNRVSVEAALAQAQQLANRQHTQVTLLVIALDGIKHVNESFGHQFGDRVLQRVAQRLRALAKPHSVARLGGDEFLMLLHDDAATQQGLPLAAQVIDSVSQPINLDGRNLSVGCSIGLAFYPQHGSMSALIANAGVAMRGATYSIFDARMVVDARGQAALLHDLRLAPGHSQLELYYQPKIHAPSAQITGVEALLRWHHPQRGTTSRTSSFRWPDAAA